jgi:LPXTG-motif cell wall-anchored protein
MKKFLGIAAVVLALGVIAAPATATPSGSDDTHQVWVCKYVGTPGVDERLEKGKNPIIVDEASTVGTWFKDGQNQSFVLAVATDENTDQGERYSGDLVCPAPTTPTPTPTPSPSVSVTPTANPTPTESSPTPSPTTPTETPKITPTPTGTVTPSVQPTASTASPSTTSAPRLAKTGSAEVAITLLIGLALILVGAFAYFAANPRTPKH